MEFRLAQAGRTETGPMPLVLQIENCDRLPDGGPVRIVVGAQGCQVGRAAGMHWVLPDPGRHISSHHFDISFAEGAWWLTDRSTNGTFLRGSRYRLEAPHRLAHQDRFQVGHYTIVALIEAEAAAAAPFPVAPQPAPPPTDPFAAAAPGWADPFVPPAAEADPWTGGWGAPAPGAGGGAASPVSPLPMAPYPQPYLPPAAQPLAGPVPSPMGRREDFGDEFIAAPVFHTPAEPMAPAPPPAQPAVLPDLPHAPYPAALAPLPPEAAQQDLAPILPPPSLPPPSLQPVALTAAGAQLSQPPISVPPSALPPLSQPQISQPPLSAPPVSTPPVSAPPAGPTAAAGDAVLAAFCAGAGLNPAALTGVEGTALAHALGRSLRMTASEVMTQLQLRAAAKQFTKGGERTMRQAEHNNPLKFLPDVEQALEAMYLRPRAGFLQGPEALAEALLDLRRHQVALFAALQPALGALLDDLAPEEVEKAGGGGGLLGGSRKAKAWETFVERWDAKSAPHENGMLDEFLRHFAAAYQESVAAQGGGGQG